MVWSRHFLICTYAIIKYTDVCNHYKKYYIITYMSMNYLSLSIEE